jgi:hypothetical protein
VFNFPDMYMWAHRNGGLERRYKEANTSTVSTGSF